MAEVKHNLKSLAVGALAAALPPTVLRAFHRGPLTILMYHGIIDEPMTMPDPCMLDVDMFRRHMKYLKKHFDVLPLSRATELLEQDSIVRPTVVITFDDGYQSNYDLAYPILVEENLPATIFISTLFTDTDRTVWTGDLQNVFTLTLKNRLEWRGQCFDLTTPANRKSALNSVKSLLKSSSHQNLLSDVGEIVSALSEDRPMAIGENSPYRMLDSASIEALAESDLVELGGHTHSHCILSRLSTADQEFEIRHSLELVAQITGKPCKLFAYPNGKRCDFNDQSLSILHGNGVTAALTTESGLCTARTPALELKRIAVDAAARMASFKLSLFDIPGCVRTLIRRERLI